MTLKILWKEFIFSRVAGVQLTSFADISAEQFEEHELCGLPTFETRE